jgi:hypothetical protein
MRPPLSPAHADPCGPRGALAPAHSRKCGRTASGAHLPRLSVGAASSQNGSAKNGNAPMPLPLRRVPRRVVVSHALPLVAPTHGHASEIACPPCCSSRPARPAVACPRPAAACPRHLPASVCSPCCGPRRLATPWGQPASYEALATWRTCCNTRLKHMKYLEHTFAINVCSHCNICNIQIKHL